MMKNCRTADMMIDRIITDLNNSVKCLMNGQMIAWCDSVHSIAVQLTELKQAIRAEEKALEGNENGED